MTEARTLLVQYAENASEEAFRELTARYVNFVYSSALRLMDGDTHRAEDVVQTVFIDLARLARTLSPDVLLGGWLHRRTCHVAAQMLRSERRRQNREKQAAEMNLPDNSPEECASHIKPALDDAINRLSARDRTAILLRYFDGEDLRSLGARLGTSEDAAQKRVSRALEKLRLLLARQGIVTSGTVLAGALTAHSATAAPLGLAANVSSLALANASASTSLTLGLLKLTTMSNLKIAAGLAVAATLGTLGVLEHRNWKSLRTEHQMLQQRLVEIDQQPDTRTSGDGALATKPAGLTTQQLAELDALRREIGTS